MTVIASNTIPSPRNSLWSYGTRRLRRALVALSLFAAGNAVSADDFRYTDSHTTSKSANQVWAIMSDYANTCGEGCKYSRPNLVTVKKLSYKSTSSRWYTWSHVSNPLKDVKFFTEVRLKRGPDGQFVSDNRQLDDSDGALIKALEAKTGLSHSPAFDAGNTRTTTSKTKDGKTKVAQVVTLRASGMVAMWPGKIREGIRESVETTFKNIGN